MKFIVKQGELLQLNIAAWFTSNKCAANCYQVYHISSSSSAAIYDATMIQQYYIRDIISACVTWGNNFYIETAQGYVHEFTGTVTTIGLLHAEFNSASKT